MKKKLALLLVATMLATTFVGCNKDEKKDNATKVEEKETPDSEEEEQVEVGNPEFTVISERYDTDNEYFAGTMESVQITDSEHEVLAKAVNDYFANQKTEFDGNCENMIKEQTENAEDENYYDYSISTKVMRADNQVFSICVDVYTYLGGAHGGTVEYGVNFDTQTGEIITYEKLGDIADVVKSTIYKDIDSSKGVGKDELYPEYADTIERYFGEGMKGVDFWFDDRGIVVPFQQYDIAPYSAGIISFNVPYADLPGFPESYIPKTDYYSTMLSYQGLADFIDVNGDGERELVYIETEVKDEDSTNIYTMHVGDDSFVIADDEAFTCIGNFIHTGDGNYYTFEVSGLSDYKTIYFFDANTNQLIEQMDGFWIEKIYDGKAMLGYRVDAFGTWSSHNIFTYDKAGFKSTTNVSDLNNDPKTNAYARGITLLKDMKYKDEQGQEQTLAKGNIIYPMTLEDNTVYFQTEDGSVNGSFTYEVKDYERYVDGIQEYEMFENLPYAG